jgi:tRNA pseudouridine38-40 synthase
MQSYKLIISYDGTDYCGWQWQKNGVSINAVMRSTFARVFGQKDEAFLLVGASRTDAGVHAEGQVLRLRTSLQLSSERLKKVWNDVLPPSIIIMDVKLIDDRFHPQHNVGYKIYEYLFFTERPSFRIQRFGWYLHKRVDLERVQEALKLFVGTHDFGSFCKNTEDRPTVLTVDSIVLVPCNETGGLKIQVRGKSFLRHMIRRIVGASLWYGMYEDTPLSAITDALYHKKLTQTLPTAPAKGLCLKEIHYI